MELLNSHYKPLCSVNLPFANRQLHMREFDLANPIMPSEFGDYIEPVLALCKAANAIDGFAYLTVDERIVEAGTAQRKPKPHVDGYWDASTSSWPTRWNGNGIRMPLIVASSVSGCKAWRGQFDAKPAENGDLSHIESELGEGELLQSNVGYLLSGDCIHESMIFKEQTRRSFLRITLPINYKFN